MKTYLYTYIIRMSNDLVEYAYKNIKDIRKVTKLYQFPIFFMNEDLVKAYKHDKTSNSNNWTYKIISYKLCPFILEFQNKDKICVTGYNQLKEIFKNHINYKTVKFTIYSGSTNCEQCPFYNCKINCSEAVAKLFGIDCKKHNLITSIINKS